MINIIRSLFKKIKKNKRNSQEKSKEQLTDGLFSVEIEKDVAPWDEQTQINEALPSFEEAQ